MDAASNQLVLSSIEGEFTYTGQRFDLETNLYYYKNRYYSANQGRFISRDPIGYIDGMNLYQYVGSRPVLFLDPMGYSSWLGDFVSGIIDAIIGSNSGEAWGNVIRDPWVRGPTGGILPQRLAEGLLVIAAMIPANAHVNGMHAWHAGSNAYLVEELGIIAIPLIYLGGLIHESPLDWDSFWAEQEWQGTVNHLLDSYSDILANIFGIGAAVFLPDNRSVGYAIGCGNYIPGPGEPDPAFGGTTGPYTGNPTDDWGQYPGGTYP